MVDRACHSLVVTIQGNESPVAAFDYLEPDSSLPEPANENLKVKCDWMTPAEALQVVQRIKRRLIRENIHKHSLLASVQRRRVWDELRSCEACLRWQYFRTAADSQLRH